MNKNRSVVSLGILLCGLALVYFWSIGAAAAARPGPADPNPVAGILNSPRTGYVRPEWRIGAPVTSGNLTVFPVTSSAWSGAHDFITLDEGLKSGKVLITEFGSTGPRGGRSIDNARVNTLSLTNRTGRTLVLLAGEMLIGGKQDRIVDQDQLIPPVERPIALGVFCVEHGRWHGTTTSFGQNQSPSGPQVPGARKLFAAGAGGGTPGQQMATPAVREKAEARKDQNEVWSKVAETTKSLNATSGTGALTRAYDDGHLAKKCQVYENQIRYRIQGKNVVGVVVAVSGRVVAADIFASPSLFQRYWPKLLKSYALEALSAGKTPAGQINQLAAESFLYRSEGKASSENKKGIYRVTEHKLGDDASFELEYTASAQPVLVHFNRIVSR